MAAIPASTQPAPNRLLDLDELGTPEFRSVLRTLDRPVARDQISYLHLSKRWEYPWALQRAQLAPGCRVLDVGCGDSIFPVYLASLGHHVTAADMGSWTSRSTGTRRDRGCARTTATHTPPSASHSCATERPTSRAVLERPQVAGK